MSHSRRLACDFCGGAQGLRSYLTESSAQEWHACAICVRFITTENWDNLIERIIAAFTALQRIPENEQAEFRHELAKAFRQRPTANPPFARGASALRPNLELFSVRTLGDLLEIHQFWGETRELR